MGQGHNQLAVAVGGDRLRIALEVLAVDLGNGLAQGREFAQAVPLTGLVLAKLDGTAKGGIAVAMVETLGVPVKYVGVGESQDDLLPFDAEAFAASLLGD